MGKENLLRYELVWILIPYMCKHSEYLRDSCDAEVNCENAHHMCEA